MLQFTPMTRELYGRLPDRREVYRHTLGNNNGLSLTIMDYGATITDCIVPDSTGGPTNVVLGYGSLEGYLAGTGYFGATIGRIAGRLPAAVFEVDGSRYTLAANEAGDRSDGGNHLHGGNIGFDKRLWSADELVAPGQSLGFCYLSPDGEEGYPGNLDATVVFSVLADSNTVRIDYKATTDKATPFSPTNHSYFNLGGDEIPSVKDHLLWIGADYYTPTDKTMTHLGVVDAVDGTGADLRHERTIGEIVLGLVQQHGDNYLLRSPGGSAVLGADRGATASDVVSRGGSDGGAARLSGNAARRRDEQIAAFRLPAPLKTVARAFSPESGIALQVATSAYCLQFFGGRYIAEKPAGRSGRGYGPYAGFCLECQEYPDGPNHPEICDTILRPGQVYRQRTEWRFTAT